jgi:hypothetical protein
MARFLTEYHDTPCQPTNTGVIQGALWLRAETSRGRLSAGFGPPLLLDGRPAEAARYRLALVRRCVLARLQSSFPGGPAVHRSWPYDATHRLA